MSAIDEATTQQQTGGVDTVGDDGNKENKTKNRERPLGNDRRVNSYTLCIKLDRLIFIFGTNDFRCVPFD